MKYKWKKLITREGVDIATISVLDKVLIDCSRLVENKIKEPFFTIIENKIFTHYLSIDELEVGRIIYKHFFKSVDQAKKYYIEGKEIIKKYNKKINYWKNFEYNDPFQWQIKALEDFLTGFDKINYRFSAWPWWGIETWQIDSENILSKLIKKRGLENRYEEIMSSIYKSWRTTAIIRLEQDLQSNFSISKLIDKYQFLRSWSAIWYRPIDKKWIQQFKKKSISKNEIKNISHQKLYKLLKPTKQEKYHIDLAPYIIFFKDYRDDIRRQYVYNWTFLFDTIAMRFNIDRNDLGYLSFKEISDCLVQNQLPSDIIAYRKKHKVIIIGNSFTLETWVIDKKIKKYLEIIKKIKLNTKKIVVLQGLSAYTGLARGKVKIIKSYHDIKRVKKGDILIANTTHPNYIPAMYKAAAFVTNEGGIASHAAIVARELKKPCVVGTKIATKVIKEGDKVEVDANKGLVKKI